MCCCYWTVLRSAGFWYLALLSSDFHQSQTLHFATLVKLKLNGNPHINCSLVSCAHSFLHKMQTAPKTTSLAEVTRIIEILVTLIRQFLRTGLMLFELHIWPLSCNSLFLLSVWPQSRLNIYCQSDSKSFWQALKKCAFCLYLYFCLFRIHNVFGSIPTVSNYRLYPICCHEPFVSPPLPHTSMELSTIGSSLSQCYVGGR